jgi:flotillin
MEQTFLLGTAVVAFAVILLITITFLASRYKRCPSDKILVVFGKVEKGKTSKCVHGGGTFIMPIIQDYRYISLTPSTISIPLQGALSKQNIRVNVPSTFTVGISTVPEIMNNAAERLLGIASTDIEQMAKEIIFGQLRLTIASLTIEQINQDRESFLESVRKNVEPELNKIGLTLLNVNITDITDESTYIESIGKKAAAEAINTAKVDVAEQTKRGMIGETDAQREQAIRVAENNASAEKGKMAALSDQRIFVQSKEAEAVDGENMANAKIAQSNANLVVLQSEARQKAEVARNDAETEVNRSRYQTELMRLRSEQVAQEEANKQQIEIAAEAVAERTRREARGQADSVLLRYEAEAKGLQKVLESKATGYQKLIESCNGDSNAAANLLLIEQMKEVARIQTEAIKNLKIDKIVVWDGGGDGENGNATSKFISGMVKVLPPLQEIAALTGIELPEYLGKAAKTSQAQSVHATPPADPVEKPEVTDVKKTEPKK